MSWLWRCLCSLFVTAGVFVLLASAIQVYSQAQTNATSPATTKAAEVSPVPPPASAPKLSSAELEKLLMPIALYPDPLLATILPASVYPLEIVQAARFMQDTNNLSKIDSQPWDDSVKAIAKIPAALKKMNDDLQWTIKLGETFLNQDKDVMDTIQSLRAKAQKAGTLQTSPQQTVVVTNVVVEKTVEQQVVVVTNTVVQIQPSNPQVVYVPSYPPTVYYPPPAYVYDPYAPLITFTAGVAMGAIIANNCDWHHGGCYWGGGDVNVDIDRNTNINVDRGDRNRVNAQGNAGKKWQPDQNRVRSSGSTASARTMESRGWSSGAGGTGGARPSTMQTGARGQGPSASTRPASSPGLSGGGAGRPSAGPGASASTRPASSPNLGGASRPSTPSASPSMSGGSRSGGAGASASPASRSSSSAFSGGGASQQSFSNRGAASRGGGGGFSGGGGGRGGGGRGGGGGRR